MKRYQVQLNSEERTIRNWWQRAGWHCQTFHERQLDQSQLELGQVQADEVNVRTQKGSICMAGRFTRLHFAVRY
jgi:hypothetical protein